MTWLTDREQRARGVRVFVGDLKPDVAMCGLSEDFTAELKDLLEELRRRNWTLLRWGPQEAPQLVAATCKHQAWTDVFILRSQSEATAYRVPAQDKADAFNPSEVTFQYHSSPSWTLRAILSLPPPDGRQAPATTERPARECFLPEGLPRPVLVRPLSPSASI